MGQVGRRRFLIAAGALLAEPLAGNAQAPARTRRIGVLFPGKFERKSPGVAPFIAALRQEGYLEPRDYVFLSRPGEVTMGQLAELATELATSRVDLILTFTSMGVAAAKRATVDIPIVFITAGDPVGQGFVASLDRPGGNITGVVTMPELDLKVLEAIRETLPSTRRVGFLAFEPDKIYQRIYKRMVPIAASLGVELVLVAISRPEDLAPAFDRAATMRLDALFVPALGWFWGPHTNKEIASQALRVRLPSFGRVPIPDEPGALMSVDLELTENAERAGRLVARIFEGAHPRDLPVEQPLRYRISINLKTARALDITIPPSVLLRANRVIE